MELSSPKLKKKFMFQEGTYKSQKQKVSYMFPYKETKFSKLIYFLIVIIKSFF